MTGPYDSVIGVQKEQILQRFLTSLPARFEAATNDVRFCAVLVECDAADGPGAQHPTHHAGRKMGTPKTARSWQSAQWKSKRADGAW